MALTNKQKSFLDSIWPQAVAVGNKIGVNPSIIAGQAAPVFSPGALILQVDI
jgi:flagellum-specific peptidoglycan hydrolase FlgJ